MKFWALAICVALFAACGSTKPVDDSPSGVVKSYVAASQKDDIAAMKAKLSKGSLLLIEQAATAQKRTVDDLLRQEASVKIKNLPETTNEVITGDTATVEIKNERTGQFDMKMPLVREDGAWKLARDKFIEEAMQKK